MVRGTAEGNEVKSGSPPSSPPPLVCIHTSGSSSPSVRASVGFPHLFPLATSAGAWGVGWTFPLTNAYGAWAPKVKLPQQRASRGGPPLRVTASFLFSCFLSPVVAFMASEPLCLRWWQSVCTRAATATAPSLSFSFVPFICCLSFGVVCAREVDAVRHPPHPVFPFGDAIRGGGEKEEDAVNEKSRPLPSCSLARFLSLSLSFTFSQCVCVSAYLHRSIHQRVYTHTCVHVYCCFNKRREREREKGKTDSPLLVATTAEKHEGSALFFRFLCCHLFRFLASLSMRCACAFLHTHPPTPTHTQRGRERRHHHS